MEPIFENLSDPIFHYARLRPQAPALHEGATTVSYRELAGLVGAAAVLLHDLGVKRDELVGVSLPVNVDHVVLLFALLRIGAVPVDVTLQRPRELDPFMQFGLSRVLTVPGVAAAPTVSLHTIDAGWRALVESRGGDRRSGALLEKTFHFGLTSGTTSGPKGVITTQRQWNERFGAAVEMFPDIITSAHPPQLLVIGELSFSGFFFFLANQLCVGGPIVLIASDDPDEIIDAISRWDDSAFFATPALVRELLTRAPAAGPLLPKVRAMFVGAAPLHAQEKPIIAKRITPNLYEIYGNAATGFISALLPAEIGRRTDTVGRIAPRLSVEIVDGTGKAVPPGTLGHVRCRGPAVSEGFYGSVSGAGAEGFQGRWFYPGDIGTLDAEGYLSLKGRVSDLIRRRGIEIFPPEIESVLATHAGVAEAAVIGVPAPDGDSQVIAVIVPRGEAQLEAVAEHCRAHLPPEKYPNQLFWVESLPKTGPGKIDGVQLRSSVLMRLASEETATAPKAR
jgi:acyl-CoA synthetase (AMP-forming)/AMP-acid ligase II